MRKFVKRYNEFLTIPIGFLLWWYSPEVLRWIDPTAAVFDAGILQMIIYGVLAFAILKGSAWLFFWLGWPKIYRYFDDEFEEDFASLPKMKKVCVSLLLFFLYLFALVALTASL